MKAESAFSRTTFQLIRRDHPIYGECLKNHAAKLGAHALDGCLEFMPSDPSSLTCAACGCHRNFHRCCEDQQQLEQVDERTATETDDDEDEDEDLNTASAPHMLLALSAGHTKMKMKMKKRVRSKFSAEQKKKMHELAEELGWRMHGFRESCCREIGITKRVFKMWMHNNKNKNKQLKFNANANANANGSVASS